MRAIGMFVAHVLTLVFAGCATSSSHDSNAVQVLFVCEHGNVKSLMGASYFNELARAQGWPFRAVSRGSAPDSDTVPDFVKSQLSAEGFDVSRFRPKPVSSADISASQLVVTIGAELPASAPAEVSKVEQWNDIPRASSDYAKSRAALKSRVTDLLERLERSRQR
jgi:arsenate reductase (thioredoxin)